MSAKPGDAREKQHVRRARIKIPGILHRSEVAKVKGGSSSNIFIKNNHVV
jgi:hypothetical protein